MLGILLERLRIESENEFWINELGAPTGLNIIL